MPNPPPIDKPNPEIPAPAPDPNLIDESDPQRPASSNPTEAQLEQETPGGRQARGHDAYAAWRHPGFRAYLLGKSFFILGNQMAGVVLGWQIYELTNSATALGLVGLVQAIPVIALALPAGHLADVKNRKHIVVSTQLFLALISALLALVSLRQIELPAALHLTFVNHGLEACANLLGETQAQFVDPVIPWIFLLLLISGVAMAFNTPARSAMLPLVVPQEHLSNAITWNSSIFQICSMTGPALGGGVVALLHDKTYVYSALYLIECLCSLTLFFFILPMHIPTGEQSKEPPSLQALAAGVKFVWGKKVMFGAITLDMFAVLLGGATALLPMFAKDILQVGPTGLGWLRAAPSIGAFVMAMAIAHLPPMQKAGRALLWSVAGFGVCTVIFGLSTSFWLSLVMLFLSGALDSISVVIRHTLVQALTPNDMRGRVSAVNGVFIGTSNELGALESGVTAALWGPIAAVVVGGCGTVVVVIAVALIWPELRKFGTLQSAQAH